MQTVNQTSEGGMYCTSVKAGERWRDTAATSGSIRAEGALLSTEFSVFGPGEIREHPANSVGEEVVAILEGEFDIDAAGEHYRLVAGEAILIPPREPRRFSCATAKGVLYRAAVLLDANPARSGAASRQPD
ncbi:cupin domain-containing protein [Paraburkholderia dipogonis]|uniref:Cupin domain-containing protein n=1 Tax=Paraburkholderia dipogonis TaxID=1211383 RepID=A0A4Y8MT13_9BURK|nr:cupin domain-containing protein [Paraburkholderia dipogonis]TFE40475.1 cupin domain-containing protein [Paraburkholderia dipogonis]